MRSAGPIKPRSLRGISLVIGLSVVAGCTNTSDQPNDLGFADGTVLVLAVDELDEDTNVLSEFHVVSNEVEQLMSFSWQLESDDFTWSIQTLPATPIDEPSFTPSSNLTVRGNPARPGTGTLMWAEPSLDGESSATVMLSSGNLGDEEMIRLAESIPLRWVDDPPEPTE